MNQLIHDRESLKELERQGEGKINWELWDRLVEQTRNELDEYFKTHNSLQKKLGNNRAVVFAYDNNGNEIHVFDCNQDCAIYFNANQSTIHKYSICNYIYNNTLLSRERLRKDVAFAMYRYALEHGKVYQGKIHATKTMKTVYSYSPSGKMIGVYESLNQFCKCNDIRSQLYTIRRRLTAHKDILVKQRLITYNFYDEDFAKEVYDNLKLK